MEFNNVRLKFNGLPKIQKNRPRCYNINFKSADIVKLSERAEILAALQKIGFETEEANKLISKYYQKGEYEELTKGDEGCIVHFVNVNRHLTPAEAVVYQLFDMQNYYMQYEGEIPNGYCNGCYDAENRDLGICDFSPLKLAEIMCKGYDIAMAGMILKEDIDIETAQRVQKYYNEVSSAYERSYNARESEYEIDLLRQNIDMLDKYTDDKKSQETGLTRPLSVKEAADMIFCNSPTDIESLNHYIRLNDTFGYSIAQMDIYDLWGKTFEEIAEELQISKKTTRLKRPQYFTNLKDKINYLKQQDEGHDDFYEDLSELDSRFFKKLPLSVIRYDAMMSSITCIDRGLRKRNIEVFNNMSDELLDKMTKRSESSAGYFAFIHPFLNTPDFAERVADLEFKRVNSPKLFNAMTREAVLDYLSDSDENQKTAKAAAAFLDFMQGGSADFMREDSKDAEIIPLSDFIADD